jgi:outer membrane murein-binding lipoprotein Lpp
VIDPLLCLWRPAACGFMAALMLAGCATGPDPRAIDAKVDRLISAHNQLAATLSGLSERHSRLAESVKRLEGALADNASQDNERAARSQAEMQGLLRALREHETELRNSIAILRRIQVVRITPDAPPMLVYRDR